MKFQMELCGQNSPTSGKFQVESLFLLPPGRVFSVSLKTSCCFIKSDGGEHLIPQGLGLSIRCENHLETRRDNMMSQLIYFQGFYEAGEEVDGRSFERVTRFMRQKDLIFIFQYWEAALPLIKWFSWNWSSCYFFCVSPLQVQGHYNECNKVIMKIYFSSHPISA